MVGAGDVEKRVKFLSINNVPKVKQHLHKHLSGVVYNFGSGIQYVGRMENYVCPIKVRRVWLGIVLFQLF